MNINKFQDDNGFVEDISDSWMYVMFLGPFGPLYFLYKKVWQHFIIFSMCYIFGALVCWQVIILTWAFYVAFANHIMRNFYIENGWSDYWE